MNQKTQMETVINDLYSFYRLFVTSMYSHDLPAKHIMELSDALTELYLGDYHRLCVSMPPRHSKSSMVTLAYPLWLIFNNPNLKILIVNGTAELSEKFGIQLRELIKKYGKLFNVTLSEVKHSSTTIMFENNQGNLYNGSIKLVGASGTITGLDADYLIIDDPYKGFEDITPSLLEKKINWFNTIIEQRIEPQTRLIILHTRWHTNDLQGYLQKVNPDDYKFITFPAITSTGKPLWEQRYTLELLKQKQKSIGERLFESIFQQKPIDDEAHFFKMENIHWHRPTGKAVVQAVRGWDIASSEEEQKGNDYTAGVPIYLLDDNSILITDYVYGMFGEETSQQVKETTFTDGVDTIQVIETGVAGAGRLLYKEWEKQLAGFFVEQALPLTSKSDRATPLQNKIYDGQVYVDIHDQELRQRFIDEFKAFPVGQHDDIVDATAHAFNYINEHFIDLTMMEIVEI